MSKKLFVIDAAGYIFRSYFALPPMTNVKGESTNALYGFVRSVLRIIEDFSVENIVVVFEGPDNKEQRKKLYEEYKANRGEAPHDLPYQMDFAEKFCELAGIPTLKAAGVEGDDTMGSVALWADKRGYEVFLCTTDKDMAQLVGGNIFLLNTYKDNLILDSKKVEEAYGVPPKLIVDLLALIGDASDNVPGVRGIGPKTASALLSEFGSLDAVLENVDKVSGKKRQENLREGVDMARLSRDLVVLNTEVEFPQEESFFYRGAIDLEGLKEFYGKMKFTTLLKELHGQEEKKVQESIETTYRLIDDEKSLAELVKELKSQENVCFDTETTALHPAVADLVGIGFCYKVGVAYYVPLNGKLGSEYVLAALKPLFEGKVGFYGHNVKYDYEMLLGYGIKVANISFDTMIASYLLNSHQRQHSLDKLSLDYFDKVKTPIEDLIGKGKKAITMAEVEVEKVCEYCCEDVDYTCRLYEQLKGELVERGLEKLFFDVEMPLVPILANMEKTGIYIDVPYLESMTEELQKLLAVLEKEIFELAGEEFNIKSPKQLGVILFEKLAIHPPKKTATGFSTSAEVLEFLKNDWPIAEKVLEYRTLEKLRSTYTETLPQQVSDRDGRIHCSFNQSVTATGRLSSQDPNLQNIPVRSSVGRRIRGAFKPQKKGWSFLSADYSQIELRLLAHFSGDPALLSAFKENFDVHSYTASQIFDVSMEEVTKEMRYQAKAVNFGIVYGQQAFGLSQELGISTKEAQSFINKYFERYSGVKKYLEKSKEQAKKSGKATTLMGRERLIPEINSKNGMLRQAAERLAVNTPLQGSQADIIKMAMIHIDQVLAKSEKLAQLVLQIHDELIFEVPDFELLDLETIIRKEMEGVVKLKVPLTVDITIGKNWEEL